LKNTNIIRYAVGIGNDIKNDTLAFISGDNITDSSRVF